MMAGFTDFSMCLVKGVYSMIPIDLLLEAGSRKMRRKDTEWQRIIISTGQKKFLSPENYV
jgi:hypothetical protein